MDILQFDWQLIWFHAYHLFASFVLALPLGWDREKSNRNFGLRTFPLVAVVTCGFMMLGISVIDSTDGEARIFQGIITGIGFIGGGSILTSSDKVKGTATAATIWNTGAIGVAVAYDRFEIAVILAALNFFTLLVFKEIKQTVTDEED
ncbi:MAG: MgtC/SapB family protein [Desulfopila sp.]|jgi:putative Mg2+ transporter-C (MgtC) family protein|nr:MgtC/SapB family protein [Desulfopila sp.]